jgi:hypothetical protein
MKRRKTQRKKRTPPSPPWQEDLKVTSVAVFSLEDERWPETRGPNESIEDPLQDWPESSGEPDQWLNERRSPSGERES